MIDAQTGLDTDLLDLIWADVDKLMYEEKNSALDSYMSSKPSCPNCKASFCTTTHSADGDEVCVLCGYVVSDRVYAVPTASVLHSHYVVGKSVYKALFHWNERIAQLNLTGPQIPSVIQQRLQDTYQSLTNGCPIGTGTSPFTTYFTKSDVGKLFGLIVNADQGSKKWMRKKYLERWIAIRSDLTGMRPVLLNQELVMELEVRFLRVVLFFDYVRHQPSCEMEKETDKLNCHKTHHCRHNLINYNLLFQLFIHDICKKKPHLQCFASLVWYLPTVKTTNRLARLKTFWLKLEKYTNIPWYDDFVVLFEQK